MSFGEDVGQKPKAKQSNADQLHVGKRLEEAATGDTVRFLFPPKVRNKSGQWVDAPSTTGVVAYHVGGAPFVRFLLADGGKTWPLWVASSTPIEAK